MNDVAGGRPSAVLPMMRDAFEAAASTRPFDRRSYRIAGAAVSIRTGRSGASASLLAAFEAWRVSEPSVPDLDVMLFDGERDGYTPGCLSRLERSDGARDTPTAIQCAGLQAFFQPDIGVLALYDRGCRRGYIWYREVAALPYYEFAAPLRHLLQWWMLARGGVLVHGAAVGIAEGGVLLGGPSGSGKSSTALACLESALKFAGDDYVAVDCAAPAAVHALYSTAKIVRGSLDRHPALAKRFRNLDRPDEKPMLFVHEFAPERLVRGFPLLALLVPVIANAARTRFVPARAADVARALAPSSVLLFPLAGALAFARIATLCRTLPAFRMELGSDPREIAAAVTTFVLERTADPVALARQCG